MISLAEIRGGLAAVALVLATSSPSASANDLPAAFVCEFSAGFFSVPEGDEFATTDAHDRLGITYASIDQESGTAQLIGKAGAADVTMIAGLMLSILWRSRGRAT